MITFENTSVEGLEAAIRGMRNPMNSWSRSDSGMAPEGVYEVGAADLDLMKRLAVGGSVHAKYRRMIAVYVDILAPLYWWKEFDTYKVGTVANSCSTMHKIAAKEFEPGDFSIEHLGVLIPAEKNDGEECFQNLWTDGIFVKVLEGLNVARMFYNSTDDPELKKKYWWQMIQLLPASYNQRRTVMMNYEVLSGIYRSRKDHKLDEWHDFCGWIERLPYADGVIF